MLFFQLIILTVCPLFILHHWIIGREWQGVQLFHWVICFNLSFQAFVFQVLKVCLYFSGIYCSVFSILPCQFCFIVIFLATFGDFISTISSSQLCRFYHQAWLFWCQGLFVNFTIDPPIIGYLFIWCSSCQNESADTHYSAWDLYSQLPFYFFQKLFLKPDPEPVLYQFGIVLSYPTAASGWLNFHWTGRLFFSCLRGLLPGISL